MAKTKLDVWDFVAVACYFAGVLGIGLYSMWRVNRGTVSGYFLAGRFMTWLPVGASLFASNIGSEHFIGLAGSGSASGIAVGAFEFNSCILLQLLGWVFLPVYIASGVCTLPEFMSKRYGGNRIRIYLAILSLLLYALTKISVNLYSGAIFIQQALQWNLYISVFLLLAATAITTVTGGLTAVMYTDTLQAIIMVTGSVILCIISFVKVGGLGQLYYKYMQAIPNSTLHSNTTCGYPREDSWTMLRDPVDSDMPWPGFLLGQTTSSIWYWCADQMIVQRALAAKSLSHAQGGVLLAGYLKLLPFFLMVLPGMISRVLFTDEVACADPDICYEVCQNHVSCSNIAYPKLVLELLPSGLRGVMLSVMLAALMSDLTSIFNSASTLFTMDVYRHIRKSHTVRELMIVGRLFVCVMTVISIIWIPVIQSMQGGELYHYLVSIMAFLVPPIAAVYLAAILWTRATEQGAFWALVIGFMISISRAVLDFVYETPDCGEPDLRPAIVARVHYMYFALILFLVSVAVVVVVSLLTKPPTPDQLIRTTYWGRHDQTQRQDENSSYTEPVEETSADPDDVENTGNAEKTELALLDKKQTHGTKVSSSDPETATTADKVLMSPLRHALRWFCGIDPDSSGVAEQGKQQRRISQLKQDPRAKIALNVNLVLLISLAVFLYVFFSMNDWFSRWSSVPQPMTTTSTYQSSNGTVY